MTSIFGLLDKRQRADTWNTRSGGWKVTLWYPLKALETQQMETTHYYIILHHISIDDWGAEL